MRYYVVYSDGILIGSATVDLELPVRKIEDVKLMADSIKEFEKMSTVVLLNWTELEEEDNEIHQD